MQPNCRSAKKGTEEGEKGGSLRNGYQKVNCQTVTVKMARRGRRRGGKKQTPAQSPAHTQEGGNRRNAYQVKSVEKSVSRDKGSWCEKKKKTRETRPGRRTRGKGTELKQRPRGGVCTRKDRHTGLQGGEQRARVNRGEGGTKGSIIRRIRRPRAQGHITFKRKTGKPDPGQRRGTKRHEVVGPHKTPPSP